MESQTHVISLLINNATDRKMLSSFLQESSYLVQTPDKISVDDWLNSSMIITDEENAKKFGKELLKIKRQSGPLFVPLIILLRTNSDSLHWLRLGFDEALHLPLPKLELISKINALLRLRVHTETQYKLIFENINIGIYQIGNNNRIVLANKSFARTLGYDSAYEVIGKNLHELGIIFGEDRHEFIKKLHHEKKIIGYESIWTRKDKKKICIRENAIIFKEEGDKEEYFASTIEDITQYKKSAQALIISEEKHRKLIEYSPYGILIQTNQKISFASEAMKKLLHNKDATKLIGKNLEAIIQPHSYNIINELITAAKKSNYFPTPVHAQFLTLDKQIVPVEVLAFETVYEDIASTQFIIIDRSAQILAKKKIKRMSHYDHLTGLINRKRLEGIITEVLDASLQHNTQVAVVLINLHRFKTYNESMGHHIGDIILKEVAKRLKSILRKTDTAARLGDDDFVIVLKGTNIKDATIAVINKVIQSWHEPIIIEDHKIYISSNMGIAISPEDGIEQETLIKNADIALSSTKNLGENTYAFYQPGMAAQVQTKISLEENMRAAIANNEFHIQYQPKIFSNTKEISGVEALLRWHHPTQGNISPKDFISIAEESGLIIPITEIVFDKVCQQITSWKAENLSPLNVAINLSVRSFLDPKLVSMIAKTIKKHEIDPHLITIEITESILVQDIENHLEIIKKLKEMGMKISIDDFGTGYSSLNYLRRFIIDSLKIDISFIKEITSSEQNALIVKAIIAMAHSLKIKVVAEGVETKEQFQYLKENNCDEIQGYYFYKPLSSEDLIKLMQSQ